MQADADELSVLLPESVLSKPSARVMRHGCHRYRAMPCLRLKSDSRYLEDNQGGTAENFAPEVVLNGFGFFYFLAK